MGLTAIIDALSAEHERRLVPKPVWTIQKMTPGLVDKMAKAIIGYRMTVTQWRGTSKLGQNKAEAVRLAAAQGLEEVSNKALAELMRTLG